MEIYKPELGSEEWKLRWAWCVCMCISINSRISLCVAKNKNLKKENIILIYTCHKGIEGFLKYSYTFMWKMIPKSFLIFSNSTSFFLLSHPTSEGEIKVFFLSFEFFWYFYDGRPAVTFMRQDIWKLCVKNSCLTYVWLNVTQSFRLLLLLVINNPIKRSRILWKIHQFSVYRSDANICVGKSCEIRWR